MGNLGRDIKVPSSFQLRVREVLGIVDSDERKTIIQEYTNKDNYVLDEENSKVFVHQDRLNNIKGNRRIEREKHNRELKTARRFATHYGVDVFLLPPKLNKDTLVLTNNKVPDGITIEVFVEFKNSIGSYRSIQEALKKGVVQAELIVIQIDGTTSEETVFNALNGQKEYLKENEHKGVIVVLGEEFLEYALNKKELTRSSFLSWPGTKSLPN
jgi:hypothetical protein